MDCNCPVSLALQNKFPYLHDRSAIGPPKQLPPCVEECCDGPAPPFPRKCHRRRGGRGRDEEDEEEEEEE